MSTHSAPESGHSSPVEERPAPSPGPDSPSQGSLADLTCSTCGDPFTGEVGWREYCANRHRVHHTCMVERIIRSDVGDREHNVISNITCEFCRGPLLISDDTYRTLTRVRNRVREMEWHWE